MLGPSKPAEETMLVFAVDGCAQLLQLLSGEVMGVAHAEDAQMDLMSRGVVQPP